MARFKAYVLFSIIISVSTWASGQVVPLLIMDNDHDRTLAVGQLALNKRPDVRLYFLNKRIESASDTAALINLLFQRAFTYQQLGDLTAGLRDFMDADNLVAKTNFQYHVPPLDFSDLFIELQAQLYLEYMATDNVKSPKMPYLIARNDLSPFKNNSYKPGLRYSVLYGYYIQSLLFNITLIDPSIQNGKISQVSSIEFANNILTAYEQLIDTVDNITYDPITRDLILHADLKASLQALIQYADPVPLERNKRLTVGASKFFKDITTILDNTLNTSKSQNTENRITEIQSVTSSSPLIKLLRIDALNRLDSTPAQKEMRQSDERVSYSDFLFAMRLRYSPKAPTNQHMYELDAKINIQILIRYALLSTVFLLLSVAVVLYRRKRKLQHKNKQLLATILKDVGDTEGYIINAYLWEDGNQK